MERAALNPLQNKPSSDRCIPAGLTHRTPAGGRVPGP